MTRAGLLSSTDVPLELTRTAGRSMSPLWLLVLGTPDVMTNYDALGLETAQRYFAARSAPLGAASLPLVTSTFFNFSPVAVARAIPSAWDKASPAQVLEAQLSGIDSALRRAFKDLDPTVVDEAAGLLRTAALAAAQRPEGRPLFAGYAALPWPGEAHLDLWHAHYLLREFRGDGHIAVCTAAGLSGVEALALHIAMAPALGSMFRASRAWTDDEWAACIEDLSSQGLLASTPDGTISLTEAGTAYRDGIESHTDELDLTGWSAIGRAATERVIELSKPIGKALADAGLGQIPIRLSR